MNFSGAVNVKCRECGFALRLHRYPDQACPGSAEGLYRVSKYKPIIAREGKIVHGWPEAMLKHPAYITGPSKLVDGCEEIALKFNDSLFYIHVPAQYASLLMDAQKRAVKKVARRRPRAETP